MDQEKAQKDLKNLGIKCVLIIILTIYVALHMGHASYLANQAEDYGIDVILDNFMENFANPLYVYPIDPGLAGIPVLLGLWLIYQSYLAWMKDRGTMYGKEHGSASFNTNYKKLLHDYIMSPRVLEKKFGDPKHPKYKTKMATGGRKICAKQNFTKQEIDYAKTQTQIYSKNVSLSLDTKLTQLNLNAIVFGGSGAGKSRFFVMPNLLQANSSYVVTDPSGELMSGTGKMLEERGYTIKCLNIEDMSCSCRYNPFAYLTEDADIPIMVKALVDNIEGPKKGGGDNKFWDETSTTLLIAICGYLFEVCHDDNEFLYDYMTDENGIPVVDEENRKVPKKDADGNPIYQMRQKKNSAGSIVVDENGQPVLEPCPNPHWKGCQNFNNVLRLLNMADVSDERQEPKDPLDKLFDDLELANPSSYAVSQYKVIKQAGTGKTAQNIIISTTAIFARFFMLDRLANLTYKDEIHLEELGQKKCALFIVTPQGDTTYNFLASLLYTQLFATLYKQGENNAKTRGTTSVALDVPVRCLIDEAANIGVIPQFPEKLATMRKYGISACPIYQNQAQIKVLLKDAWETIVGNCDTMLFLGGIDTSTVKMVSDRLGKGTIYTHNESSQHGGKGGGSTSVSTSGRELMTTTELEQMKNDHCITFIRSMKPFYDYKYPLEQHPNYKESGMANDENAYVPNWHLKYDKSLMARIAVRTTDDPDYIKPERVEGVSDAEIAKVQRGIDQAAARAQAANQNMGIYGGLMPNPQGVADAAAAGVLNGIQDQPTADDIRMETYEDPTSYNQTIVENLRQNPIGEMLLQSTDTTTEESN